jgi:hypothetical protein
MAKCRVTFYDLQHDMRRTVEVKAATPSAAARAGFGWMRENHFRAENFGPIVKVEVLSSTMVALPLSVATEAREKTEAA